MEAAKSNLKGKKRKKINERNLRDEEKKEDMMKGWS